MTVPDEPTLIADSGRFVIAEDGQRVLLIDRGRGPSELTTFALVILTLVCGGIGTVSMFYAAMGSLAGSSVIVGAVLLATGLVSGAGMLIATKSLRHTRLAQLRDIPPVAVFDREHGVFLDCDGEIVASLDQVRFERRGSAPPDLVATTPAGDRVLLHGNLFSGTISNLDEVLTDIVRGRPDDQSGSATRGQRY